ncbi:TPR repeat [Rhodopseudomonas palustris BisB5]|uniref:TPR repeat n=1 Tax=Rhodopseudomonas palustris (strain BisB5) TaxID=316057 RepID=Q136N5_RHOPS|nr:TPR repeat [Rhodopseudomonas palustris BisB5]
MTRPIDAGRAEFNHGRLASIIGLACAVFLMAPPAVQAQPKVRTAQAQASQPLNQHLDAAQAALDRKSFDEAIREARLALEIKPSSTAAISILLNALIQNGNEAQALSEADRLISASEASGVLLSQRGFLRRKAGRLEAAVSDFERARRAGNGNLTDAQRRTLDEAIAEANTAIVAGDIAAAQSAFDGNDFAAAEARAAKLRERLPESEPVNRILVESLLRQGRTAEALAAADRFIASGRAGAQFRAERGYIRRREGALAGAAEDFHIAAQDPALSDEERRRYAAAEAEANDAQDQATLNEATRALNDDRPGEAIERAQRLLARKPDSETARSLLSTALARQNKIKEAIAELDAILARDPGRGDIYAQRGYYKRRIQDLAGARADFIEALNRLTDAAMVDNVKKAVAEIDTATAPGQRTAAVSKEDEALKRIAQLARQKRYDEALRGLAAIEAEVGPKGWILVQRGLIYREQNRFAEAATVFRRALASHLLESGQILNVQFWEADCRAELRKRAHDIEGALAIYRSFVAAHPKYADGWYKLGYLLLAEKRINEAGPALLNAINIKPTTSGYLDAAGTFILTDAPLASKLFRNGLDGVAQKKPEDPPRTATEIEQIKNNVVRADQSFRVTLSTTGITNRPYGAGGSAFDYGGEATVRFDGRYLPAIEGVEAYLSGYHGQDQTGFAETNAQIGVRWRPFRDIDFSIGPSLLQRFEPDVRTQLALNWGLGLGGAAYPYQAKFEGAATDPYWDFAMLGTWRTADHRYLQDAVGNVGVMFGARSDKLKSAIGPTLWGMAAYDSAATDPWAFGVGPSLLGRIWIGGDQYRSYDGLLQFQLGYVTAVGDTKRQQGWRGKIILYF